MSGSKLAEGIPPRLMVQYAAATWHVPPWVVEEDCPPDTWEEFWLVVENTPKDRQPFDWAFGRQQR